MAKGMLRLALAALLAVSIPHAVCADPLAKRAFNNMAHETIECAAFYLISWRAFENSAKIEGALEMAVRAKKAADDLIEWAILLTKEAGLKPETVTARLKLALQEQSARIDNNTSNLSILMAEHGLLCKEVTSDPEARARFWIEKEAQR